MPIGVEAINAYVGTACVDVRDLFEHRGLAMARFGNLMMERKSVSLPCEDAVTNAVNAAAPLVAALTPEQRATIELVAVGTESGLDFGKPLSTYVHGALGLSPRCRSLEVKHACYGGTGALQLAAAVVATSPVPGARALVIATDAPSVAARGTYWEPSEGAGAVAMLVGSDPRVLRLDPGASGLHTYEVMDTLRPRSDVDVVNSDLSLLAYLTCLEHAYRAYAERVGGADVVGTFDYLVFHTPFAGMVKGAHRMLLRKFRGGAGDDVETDFKARVEPSLRFGSVVGNLFSGALYLALCGTILSGHFPAERRLGLFSYGSGCGSEFFSGVVPPAAAAEPALRTLPAAIEARRRLTVAELDTLSALGEDRAFGVREAVFPVDAYADVYATHVEGRGLLVLDRIHEFHREYRWS